MFKKYRKLWWTLLAFIILSPIGLIATGTAFGEWGPDELIDKIGFVPVGFERFSDLWHAPLPDYGISGFDTSFMQSAMGYIFSAVIGVVLIAVVVSLLSKIVKE